MVLKVYLKEIIFKWTFYPETRRIFSETFFIFLMIVSCIQLQ